MIHCNPAASAARLCPIAESPTLTTEPSIKARLEARMVVASTSCGWPAVFLVAADRAVATSQNGWRAAYIHLSPAHAGGYARESRAAALRHLEDHCHTRGPLHRCDAERLSCRQSPRSTLRYPNPH